MRARAYLLVCEFVLAFTCAHARAPARACVFEYTALFPVPISTRITRAVQLGSVMLAALLSVCDSAHCRLDVFAV